jgi:hypothetical protein
MLIHDLLKEEMGKILDPIAKPLEVVDGKPYVIMVVRRQRRGQDHDHRQDRQQAHPRRQIGDHGRGRHLPPAADNS